MPKKIDYSLTKKELQAVEKAMKKDPDHRVRRRAQIIRLLHKGLKPALIAELLSISVGQVYWWHKRWRSEGIEGLRDNPRSGRPQAYDEEYLAKLEEVLENEPTNYGYRFKKWSVPRLLAHMKKETGIIFSERTMYNILNQMN